MSTYVPFDFIQDTATEFVGKRFTEASTLMESTLTSFQEYTEALAASFSENHVSITEIDFNTQNQGLSYDLVSDKPISPDLDYTEPGQLKTLTLKDETYSVKGIAPTLSADKPAIQLPTTPDATLPTSPDAAPTYADIVLPDKLLLSFPDLPTLSDIVIKDAPALETLQFEGVMPEDDLDPPTAVFMYNEEVYTSLLKDPLDAKILADMVAGGTGLDSDVEEAIYLRARARQDQERNVAHTEATNYFASRGFSLPTGALQARLSEIDRKFTDNLVDINRDIVIKQAEMTWENIKATITAGLERENSLMGHFNNVAARAFEAAKYEVESAINVFKAQVDYYNAKLSAYQTQASVFTERVRAQLAVVEMYKAQLEGSKLEADIQRLGIDLYNAQLDGIKSQVDIYNAQMQGAATEAQIEKLKLEGYQAAVSAYMTKVQAKVAEYNMYQAQISGELAKVTIYSEQVKAFMTESEAFTAEVNRVAIQYKAQSDYNQSLLDEYTGDIARFKAESDASLAVIDAKTKKYVAEGGIYESSTRVALGDAELQLEEFKANIQQSVAEADIALKNAELNLNEINKDHELRVEALKANVAASAQLISSALTAGNVTAAIGFDGGFNSSYQYDKTKETDAGETTSRTYNYYP